MIIGLRDRGPEIVRVYGQVECLNCGKTLAWFTCISADSLQRDIKRQKAKLGPCQENKRHAWEVAISYKSTKRDG